MKFKYKLQFVIFLLETNFQKYFWIANIETT